MAINLGELQVHITAQTAELQKALSGMQGQFAGMGKSVAQVGVTLAKFGAAGAAALGTVAIASGKMAMDFQTDMANVHTLLGPGTEVRLQELSNNVKGMSVETGKSLSDLAGGLYQVVSAFGDSADSAKILEISAKASTAGLATTTDAVDLLSAVTKGYGDTSAGAVQKVSDLAFQTVKLGQTTFPELAANMGKTVPLAATLGVEMESLFGAMSTLTGVTGNTAEVSTQLRATLQAIINPTKEMQTAFDGLGVSSGAAAIQSFGLQGTLDKLKEATGGNTAQMAQMFGSVEALNAVLALTGPQAENFTAKTNAMTEAQGASDEAFKIQQQTVAVSMARLKQSVAVVGVELGERFLPILQSMADWVIAHLPQIQAFFETTFAAISTAISWVSENIAPLFAGSIENASGIASAAMEMFRDTVMPVLETVWGVIQKFVEAVRVIWAEWGNEIMAVTQIAFETLWTVIGGVFEIIGGLLDVFIGAFTGDWERMGEGLKAIWDGLWSAIEAAVGGAWDMLKVVFGGLWDSLSSWFSDLVGDAVGWGRNMMQGFLNGITGMFGRIWSKVEDFVEGITAKVKNALGIASPSKVFADIGTNIGKGLALGIEGTEKIVNASMQVAMPVIPKLPAIEMPATDASAFTARVMSVGGGMGGMTPDGQLAMAMGGGTPSVNVYIGERQLEDIWVEVQDRSTRRGRS